MIVEKSPNPMRFVAYDTRRYDFAALLRTALGVGDLASLRADQVGEEGWSIYRVMEQTASYRTWWALTEGEAFADLYAAFVRDVVAPLFDEAILVQSCPTPRIVYADQTGEPRFHRDCDYGHSLLETNFQVALTPCVGTNAIWIESAPNRGDYHPAEYGPGEMLVFNGASLSHGAMPNTTGRSRVSFDFRAIRKTDATPSHRDEAGKVGKAARGAHVFTDFV